MTRYAHATYCDDIRQEVGGKITLVGIYSGQCLVPMIPCTLPKLCLALYVSASRSKPVSSLSVSGVFAGTEVVNMVLDSNHINEIMAPSNAQNPDAKQMMLVLMATMAPFNVIVPGKLTLTVTADGEDIFCEGLNISTAPEGTIFGM
ncbi:MULTISPECIES: hypothetical protein [unclassified Pseudomonas]|uniref:DUF6941 family protein n=1 Tax=unclassified Pseudomonas TaxID=196821 RepID=UPI0011A4ECA9|nr:MULTISPECIES: hypothetical protein [unclassified Pseudomonas]